MDSQTQKVLNYLLDESSEPFLSEYSANLRAITNILSKYPTIEGNVFGHHATDPTTYPRPEFKSKRHNLSLFAITKTNILEIGFNAGHSALLMLTANPQLKYTAIDLCCNLYTRECYQYLKSVFGESITLIEGNSMIELPKLLHVDNSFDGYIIDGDHTTEVAYADLLNITQHAKNGSVLCFDDSEDRFLRSIVNFFMMRGVLHQIVDAGGFIPDAEHLFFRITK